MKAGELNVRKEPNKQGRIIGTLRSEDSVKVKRLQGADWAEIDYKGHKAYISTHFLMKQYSEGGDRETNRFLYADFGNRQKRVC